MGMGLLTNLGKIDMAKRKWFDKDASLEQGEVVLEDVQEAEVVAWSDEPVEETPYVAVEATVPTEPARTDELTQADIKWAKANLKGNPHPFDSDSAELLERLVRYGIAADFGDDGFGRGYKFPTV